jgi:transketolase
VRNSFLKALEELAAEDERINLVVGDLGFSVVENFMRRYPDRFVNAGVAEQNMTGLASGMALSGRTVFTYSIANFPTLRCLEQIRNDVCYHKANVKIVSVGGGLAYGALGASHQATEDLAVLRAMPGMVVIAPGDPIETTAAVRAIAAHQGPCYLRLGKAGEPVVHTKPVQFTIGRAIQLSEGCDVTIISIGGVLALCDQAARELEKAGVSVRLVSMPTLKPLDQDAVLAAARETKGLVTVEEHSAIGGLGSAVAETLAAADLPARLRVVALPDAFCRVVGSQEHLRATSGLTAQAVSAAARSLL